jgi:hypothetical protein
MSRYLANQMPSIDDIVMQILGMSEALCKPGQKAMGREMYNTHRPPGWPTAYTWLSFYGFEPSNAGWNEAMELLVIPHHPPRWCVVCGNPELLALNRCNACYTFLRKNGKERPRHLWDIDATCKTCGFPLASAGREKKGCRSQRSGWCKPCSTYRITYGKSRPRHLWGIGPVGWCECGYPAVALVAGDIPVCERHRE